MNLLKDNRDKNWFMVENDLIDNINLTIYEKMVYMVLVRHANEESSCFPSITTIAKKTGCSRPTAIKALNSLEKLGLIKKVVRTIQGRKENDSNLYYVMSIGGSKGDLPPSKPVLPPKEENVSKVVNEVDHVVNEVNYPSKGDLPQVVNDVDCNNTNINNTNITSMYIDNEDKPVDKNLSEFSKLYQQNIGVVNGITEEWLMKLSKEMELDLFRRAVEICTERGKLTQGYLKGIIKQWNDNNITTYDQLKALELEREQEKLNKNNSNNIPKVDKPATKKTKFHNFDESFNQYSANELDEIIKKSQKAKFG